jgi:hypothetical protein
MEVGNNDQEAGDLISMLIELQKEHKSYEEEVDAIISGIKPQLLSLVTQLIVDTDHTHAYATLSSKNDV